MSVELKNIFPKPSEISEEVDEEIKELIKSQFKEKGKIDFHDMLKYFDKAVEEKDFKRANISAYYCTNALLGNVNMSGDDKAEIILSLRARIERMQGRDPEDIYISGQ